MAVSGSIMTTTLSVAQTKDERTGLTDCAESQVEAAGVRVTVGRGPARRPLYQRRARSGLVRLRTQVRARSRPQQKRVHEQQEGDAHTVQEDVETLQFGRSAGKCNK